MNIKEMEKEILNIKERLLILEQHSNIKKESDLESIYQQQSSVPIKQKKSISEASVGKYAMPIIATVLIMIGVSALAFMGWNYLSDLVKSFIILVMAVSCFGFGFLFGKKDGMKTFKYTMFSIGMSILYSDIIALNVVWKITPILITFILIITWCFLNIFLSKRYVQKLFYYITEVGLMITTSLTVELIYADLNSLILILFTISLFAVIFFCYNKQFHSGNCTFGLSFLWILFEISNSLLKVQTNIFVTLIKIILIISILIFVLLKDTILYSDKDKKINQMTTAILAGMTIMFPIILNIIGNNKLSALISIITLAVLYGILRNENHNMILQSVSSIPVILSVIQFSSICRVGLIGLSLLTIYYFIISIKTKKTVFYVLYIIADIIACMYLCLTSLTVFLSGYEDILLSGIPILVANAFIIVHSQKNRSGKYHLYVATIIEILSLCIFGFAVGYKTQYTELAILLTVGIAVGILLGITMYYKSAYKNESCVIFSIISGAFNICLLILYVLGLDGILELFLSIIILIHTVLILYTIDITSKVFKNEIICSILITINIFTLASKTILYRYAMLFTLFLMVIAVIFIICGFAYRRKGLRFYGLILLILGVVKMIVVDIAGSDPMVRVIALIVGGVICLGVSFMYNKLEKNLIETKQ